MTREKSFLDLKKFLEDHLRSNNLETTLFDIKYYYCFFCRLSLWGSYLDLDYLKKLGQFGQYLFIDKKIKNIPLDKKDLEILKIIDEDLFLISLDLDKGVENLIFKKTILDHNLDKKSLSIAKDILLDLNILYVEDEDFLRENMEFYLRRRVKRLFSSTNGIDGYDSFLKHSIDIVITDINMPRLNGFGMAKKIREQNISTPILVTSAHNEPEFFKNALDDGINGYIVKPFDYHELDFELYKVALIYFSKK